MKKSILYSIHGFIWFCALSIVFLATLAGNLWANENILMGLKGFLGISFGSLTIFYSGYFLIALKFISQRKNLIGVLSIILLVLIFPLIPLSEDLILAITDNSLKKFPFSGYTQLTILSLIICSSGAFFKLFINWINEEQQKKELENEKIKMKLQVLVNQNNPHFLFNILNNIDSLIVSKPAKASETINKLSELLRYIYANSEKDRVPVLSEIEYIENYVELQSLRHDDEINIQIEKGPKLKEINIVPMIFLPFVENVFKHGCLGNNNPILLRFSRDHARLHFYCQNRYSSSGSKKNNPGFGISNIMKRLELVYSDSYKLNIENTKDTYSVSLILELDETST